MPLLLCSHPSSVPRPSILLSTPSLAGRWSPGFAVPVLAIAPRVASARSRLEERVESCCHGAAETPTGGLQQQ